MMIIILEYKSSRSWNDTILITSILLIIIILQRKSIVKNWNKVRKYDINMSNKDIDIIFDMLMIMLLEYIVEEIEVTQ